jgi:hypothetical protein
MLVREKRASSANGAFGRHERHEVLGMRLLTPLPTAFPLSGAGAGMMGLLGGRRRRTNPSIGGCVKPVLFFGKLDMNSISINIGFAVVAALSAMISPATAIAPPLPPASYSGPLEA